MNLATAIRITAVAFEHTLDKGGTPYFDHCYEVMRLVRQSMPKYDGDILCAAILHDIIEDTTYTFDKLEAEGFSDRVIELLVILTRRKNEEYTRYIQMVAMDNDATRIKIADLTHNLDGTRLNRPMDDDDLARVKKYTIALDFLKRMPKGQ